MEHDFLMLFLYSGKTFFRGPWLLTPPEVPGTSSRFFYRQELMLSTVQETSPMVAVVGRCAVLDHAEYSTSKLRIHKTLALIFLMLNFLQFVRLKLLKAMYSCASQFMTNIKNKFVKHNLDKVYGSSRTAKW